MHRTIYFREEDYELLSRAAEKTVRTRAEYLRYSIIEQAKRDGVTKRDVKRVNEACPGGKGKAGNGRSDS